MTRAPFVTVFVIVVGVACGKTTTQGEQGATTSAPEAATAPTLEPALARLEPRERAWLFQRCPPVDEAADAALAALRIDAATCRTGGDDASACTAFVATLERTALDASGCYYGATPRRDDSRGAAALQSSALDLMIALRAATIEAKARAEAGRVDDAARLAARVARTMVVLARSDDAIVWANLEALRGVSALLDGWSDVVSEDAALAVRAELQVAKRAWLELEFGLRAALVRDAERGRNGGGLDGEVFAEAALVTLDALLDGADLASQEATLAATWRANADAIEQLSQARATLSTLTPRERGLVVLNARLTVVRGLTPIVAAHAAGEAALTRLGAW